MTDRVWIVEEKSRASNRWWPLGLYDTRALARINMPRYRRSDYVLRVRQYVRVESSK